MDCGPVIRYFKISIPTNADTQLLQRRQSKVVVAVWVAEFEREKRKMSKFGRKLKNPPDGFDEIEPVLTALDNELRESKCNLIIYSFFLHLSCSIEF